MGASVFDSTVIGAIIAGSVALLIEALRYLGRKREQRELEKFSPQPAPDRRRVLLGQWLGHYVQETGKEEFLGKHPAKFIFREEKGAITGDLDLRAGDTNQISDAKLINLVFDGKLFKVDYVNRNSNTTHFGTVFGKVTADGAFIEGLFTGYGMLSERFVSGRITLHKSGSEPRDQSRTGVS